MERLLALTGIAVMIGGCWWFSSARSAVRWRIVGVGVALQLYLAAFLVRPDAVLWLLPLACAACLGLIVAPRKDDALTFLARGLAAIGMLTALVAFWCVADTPAQRAAVVVAAALVYLGPSVRPEIRRVAGIAGCVLPPLLLWTGVLPDDFLYQALSGMSDGVKFLLEAARQGALWVFGDLANQEASGWIFAIQVSAIVIFFSALLSILHYLGLLPWLVGMLARMLYRTMGVSGAEALAAASNVFIGQTEAPLAVRPYLQRMTRSEIAALMAGGFATIAGSVFGIYLQFLEGAGFRGAGANLIAASVMSAPAAIVFAKLLVPETGEPETVDGADLPAERMGTNLLDALAGGVTAGVKLAVNITAMLLVFYALIWMLNEAVGWAAAPLTFQKLYGWLFAPFALLVGVPAGEATLVGELLGTKTIFNEFIAYEQLGGLIESNAISRRSALLSTYALCGFANFMSIGIQIGGLAALAPKRRPEFASLAVRAMIAGALACQLTACIVGLLVG